MFNASEHGLQMNTVLRAVTAGLADVGLVLTTAPAEDGLTVAVDAGPRRRLAYPAVVRAGSVDRRLATALTLPDERPLLLLAPYVPDAAADVLRARGVDHADAVGNAHLDQGGVLIDIRGRRPTARTAGPPDPAASRAFTRSGVRVLLTLLTHPETAARPVRHLAEASGVSVGTAHTVLHDLTGAGYLRDGTAGRTLHRGGELLDRWAEAYAVTLARAASLGSFTLPDPSRAEDLTSDLLAAGAQLGGEAAAQRIDPHLHPSTTTWYVDELPADVLTRHRLRRDDLGSVHLRRRFWPRPTTYSATVPAPLVLADLLASGDPRQRDHAERIRRAEPGLVELDRT